MHRFSVAFYLITGACLLVFGAACVAQTPAPATGTQQARRDVSPAQAAAALRILDDEAGGTSSSSTTNDAGPVGIVPAAKGFNFSLGTTSQHDSAGGWSSLLTPNVAFRFSRHFSLNAGLPVFGYINNYGVISTKSATKTEPAVPIYGFKPDKFLLGDTTITMQFEIHPAFFDYAITSTLGIPSGDDADGLGAGQPTYDFNNHFEHPFGQWITPELEIGVGNSANLVDPRVRKSYIDVGTNAHFQTGLQLQLPFNISFTTDAFEELPLGTQTVTSTTTNGKKGKQLKTITTITNVSIGEDNGFLNTLDIPLSPHVTLSGFYNRSLRYKIDTAGFSFTFLLKAPLRGRESVH